MKMFCLLFVLFIVAGCGGDDDPVAPTAFALAIDNRVATSYDVYQAGSSAGPFVKVGYALSGVTYWIRGLEIGKTYVFRLVPPGSGADTFHYERSVSSAGPDITWIVQ